MAFIDKETVQKILDTADIVEVVSDFVSLKRRGANYIGLCPFHNERTPSFSVSKSKGICKCFSCGKGGSPVGFVMEHEKMSYNEALRFLAKKYNIEIKEHELTDEEREQATDRENMFAVNEFALKHFASNLVDTDEGRDIGLSYFRQRGISDEAIRRFHLGFSLERGNELLNQATAKGYNKRYLLETGLIAQREDGSEYDRFRGRVMYPVHTISGKVVAFGGRTLRSDKKMAKYVNSPESAIYSKSRELYGLYQAKRAITEKGKCILVEGYMDVISMSQLGIENIVASSGTSLTEGQIRLIHRFAENVTLIYDSDPAGIKASLRGIDMLLAEGLNIKVVLLPEGDDPDSFAQSHTLTEVEDYIQAHERDFISFKSDILLHDANNDPIARSRAISDIVQSISVIPDEIVRSLYVKECSRNLNVDEGALLRQIKKYITERLEKEAQARERNRAAATLQPTEGASTSADSGDVDTTAADAAGVTSAGTSNTAVGNISGIKIVDDSRVGMLKPFERTLARLILRYGLLELPSVDENGNSINISVIDYVVSELTIDGIEFTNAPYRKLVDKCCELARLEWPTAKVEAEARSIALRTEAWNDGIAQINSTAQTLDQIKIREQQLVESINAAHFKRMEASAATFFIHRLASSPDDEMRNLVNNLASSRHKLSKVHSKFSHVETEQERLSDILPVAIYSLRNGILQYDLKQLRAQLKEQSRDKNADPDLITDTMRKIAALDVQRREYAQLLGERVVLPK